MHREALHRYHQAGDPFSILPSGSSIAWGGPAGGKGHRHCFQYPTQRIVHCIDLQARLIYAHSGLSVSYLADRPLHHPWDIWNHRVRAAFSILPSGSSIASGVLASYTVAVYLFQYPTQRIVHCIQKLNVCGHKKRGFQYPTQRIVHCIRLRYKRLLLQVALSVSYPADRPLHREHGLFVDVETVAFSILPSGSSIASSVLTRWS